jgi:hypothetical protein
MLIPNGPQWNRASLVVQTAAGVSPVNDYYLEIRLDAPDAAQFPTGTTPGATLTITNVQVQEGEWVTGYMGSQYVPSGAIILWDKPTSCPPGYSEVTAAQDRFLLGANAVAAGAGFGTFVPGGSMGSTGGESNPHHHTINNDPVQVKGGSGGDPYAQNGTNDFDTGDESAGHTHVLPSANMPYYGIKLCRAQ